jgi:hypothetical protein
MVSNTTQNDATQSTQFENDLTQAINPAMRMIIVAAARNPIEAAVLNVMLDTVETLIQSLLVDIQHRAATTNGDTDTTATPTETQP